MSENRRCYCCHLVWPELQRERLKFGIHFEIIHNEVQPKCKHWNHVFFFLPPIVRVGLGKFKGNEWKFITLSSQRIITLRNVERENPKRNELTSEGRHVVNLCDIIERCSRKKWYWKWHELSVCVHKEVKQHTKQHPIWTANICFYTEHRNTNQMVSNNIAFDLITKSFRILRIASISTRKSGVQFSKFHFILNCRQTTQKINWLVSLTHSHNGSDLVLSSL